MILVTGGTGFLGAYIIRELRARGLAVRATRRSATLPAFLPKETFDGVDWFETDILDPIGVAEALEGVDAIVHAAAMVSYDPADRREMLRTNVEGTATVVNAALEAGVRRIVYISSVAALGRPPGEAVGAIQSDALLDETAVWEPAAAANVYATSKQLSEREVWRGIAEGLEGVVLNPSVILGYGDLDRSSGTIFRSVRDGMPWYTDGGAGFVDVEDVARAAAELLADARISGERFIVNAENLPFRTLFDRIAGGLQVRPPRRKATPFLAGLAWRLEKLRSVLTGKKPFITAESSRIGLSTRRYDNRKLLAALPGFRYTPIAETIDRACRAYAGERPENRIRR